MRILSHGPINAKYIPQNVATVNWILMKENFASTNLPWIFTYENDCNKNMSSTLYIITFIFIRLQAVAKICISISKNTKMLFQNFMPSKK